MPQDAGRLTETDPPTRKRRPPLVTRTQVVEVAYRLISEEGPAGLSMRKLASALHVSLPTVYTAIESREVLVGELQDRLFEEIAEAVAVGTPASGVGGTDGGAGSEGSAVLRGRGRALLAWSRRRPQLTEFLLVEEVDAGLAERAVRAAGRTRRSEADALLRSLVGPASAAQLDGVTAVAIVIAETRAALWLANQDRLRHVDAEQWVALGCDHVARALEALAASSPVGSA